MRNERFGRGRNGGGGRHSGRGGRGGRGGGGRSRSRGGGGQRRGRRRMNPRQAAESGNKRERIAVESGHLVLIDQFMLANPQFIEKLLSMIDETPEKKNELVNFFGGLVVNLTPGTYRIERDPFAQSIVIHPESSNIETDGLSERATDEQGHVFIDTRCLAMVDRELLDDSTLLEKYQQLWFSGQDKACRDLLRDNGGAVRYGFHRNGDELGVYIIPQEDVVCLWSDVFEPQVQEAASAQ